MERNGKNFHRLGGGGFQALSSFSQTKALMAYAPLFVGEPDPSLPRRKNMAAPAQEGLFVKPLRQDFVRNPRAMPMTRIMLAMLSGWAGHGGCIETTVGILGRHIGRCRRQVFRYLKDALEEGFLVYSRTKDRVGRYTGIRIWLNFAAIRHTRAQGPKVSKTAGSLGVTLKSETKEKHIYNGVEDSEMSLALERMALSLGLKMPNAVPT